MLVSKRIHTEAQGSHTSLPIGKHVALSFFLTILGFFVAFGIFLIYQDDQQNKYKRELIPRARLAYLQKDYSQAIQLFSEADKEFPDNLEVKKSLADLYFLKGFYGDTVKYYAAAYNLDRNFTTQEISNYGVALLKTNNIDALVELWSNQQLSPEDSYRLAEVYLQKKEFDKYKLELEKIKGFFEPLIALQVFNKDLEETYNMLNTIEHAPKLGLKSYNFELFKNQIIEAKKQFDLGKIEYSELITLAAFANIEQCQFIQLRIENLKEKLIKQNIPIYQVEFLEGKCLNQLGDPDAAINLINKAIEADKSNIDYLEELANSYFLKGDLNTLHKIYNEIFLISRNFNVLNNYAGFVYKLGKKYDAVKYYLEAFDVGGTSLQKKSVARTILQIHFIDLKDLEVCNNANLLEALNEDDFDDYFLLSHCRIYKNIPISEVTSINRENLAYKYLNALSRKDKAEIEKLLDQDPDGLITTYYLSIGQKLFE
jgi:tetratricopeptide (TPR) repeat protein